MLHGCTLSHLITKHLLNMDKFTATGCCDEICGFHYPELVDVVVNLLQSVGYDLQLSNM